MWALACPGVAGAPGRAAADPYADALAEAARLEGAGEVAEAAARLDAAIVDYPQDYALILQAGWLHFQSGDYVRAEARYRRAIELSGGSHEARLGLAWARLRQGEREEAEERFAALAAEAPADPRAREGLAAARYRVPVIAAPSASATLQLFPRGDGITAAPGASVGLPFVVRERLLVGVDYNFARFLGGAAGGRAGGMNMNMNMGMDMGPGPGPLAPGSPVLGDRYIDRHALYLHAGATWERVGFTGHYGYIHDGGALVGNAHVAGVALRYSPLGDLSLAATGSFYPDQAIPRVALGWAAPATARRGAGRAPTSPASAR